MRALIKRELKVEISKVSLSRLLKNRSLSAKRPIFNKEEMKSSVLSIMKSIQKKTHLIQSFFKMKDTKYIIEALSI